MPAAIVWWEIETPAPESFQAFHAAMWSWEFRPAFTDQLAEDYWIITAEGTSIGGLQRAASSDRPHAGVRLYVEVDDLEESLARAAELGAELTRSRTELGGDDRWFATLTDPAGVSFGLWTSSARR